MRRREWRSNSRLPIVALFAAVGRNNVGRGQFETHHKGSIMRLGAKNEDRERPPVGSKWSGARVMDQWLLDRREHTNAVGGMIIARGQRDSREMSANVD